MCQIILAPEIDVSWIPLLELLVSRHHTLFEQVSPTSFTPKMHFLVHYARLILQFGLLNSLWCMRFEAKHQYFKQIARKVKNFQNITSTLSKRHQIRNRADDSGNSPFCTVLKFLENRQVFLSHLYLIYLLTISWNVFTLTCSRISFHEQVVSVNGLKLNGQNFHTGTVLVCDVITTDEMPLLGAIEHILHCHGLWLLRYFLYLTTRYMKLYDAFCIKKSDWTVILPGEQADHPPLAGIASYTIDSCSGVLLCHRICAER